MRFNKHLTLSKDCFKRKTEEKALPASSCSLGKIQFLVRLEFEIKLEPLLLYRPTAPATATAPAPLF